MIKNYRIFVILLSLCISSSLWAQDHSELDSIKLSLSSSNDHDVRMTTYYSLVIHYYDEMNFDSALHYNNLYVEEARSLHDTLNLALSYRLLSFVYDLKGYINKALLYSKTSLQYFISHGDSARISDSYNDVGYFLSYGKDQSASLLHFLNAIKIARKIQDTLMISYASSNIAFYYEKLEDYENAYKHYNRALELDVIQGDSFDLAHAHNNMALILSKIGDTTRALIHTSTSKSFISSDFIDYDISNIYIQYIDIYLELGILDSVKHYIKKQEGLLKDYSFLLNEAYLFAQRGRLKFQSGSYNACILDFRKALSLMEVIGEEESQARIYKRIGMAYAALGNFQDAYDNRVLANQLEDSMRLGNVFGMLRMREQELIDDVRLKNTSLTYELKNQKIVNKQMRSRTHLLIAGIVAGLFLIIMLITTYFLLRQRKTNASLEIQNRKTRESEKELKKLNATKDRFFSIIAHDLKNPLSSVIGLSNLYIKDSNAFNPKDIKPIMESLNQSASYGFNILENLLEWALANTGELIAKPKELKPILVINELLSGLRSTSAGKNIEIELVNNHSCSAYFDENMLKTILRNLIHNAIKFSHEHSTISVSCIQKNKEIIISVQDTGIGISKDMIGKLFSSESKFQRYGTKNEKGTGLGLLLCLDFVEKNNGKIWVESEEGVGSKFSFTLPISS